MKAVGSLTPDLGVNTRSKSLLKPILSGARKAADVLKSVISINTKSLEADNERLLSLQRYLAGAYSHIGYAHDGNQLRLLKMWSECMQKGKKLTTKDSYQRSICLQKAILAWVKIIMEEQWSWSSRWFG